MFFFSRSNPFTIFQDGLCSSNKHVFPGESICSSNRRNIFQESSSNRHVFSRRFICSSNRPYYLIEQILIFPETLISPQTHTNFPIPLFSHRTDFNFPGSPLVLEHIIIFQETPMPRTDRHFPGRYPPSNRYFDNRSRWLLSHIVRTKFRMTKMLLC